MINPPFQNLKAATQAPWFEQFGVTKSAFVRQTLSNGWTNGFTQFFRRATGNLILPLIGSDGDSATLAGTAVQSNFTTKTFAINANATLATQAFWIADREYFITGLSEVHAVAGNDSGAVTGYITKERGTQAPGTGVSVMTSTFNLKGTANTPQTGTVSTNNEYLRVAAGDRLSFVFTGVLTTLVGVVVEVQLMNGELNTQAVFNMLANGSLADQNFFVATRPCVISRIDYVHSVAGTNGSAVNLQVEKCTGTTAPGSGTNLLTNNTNAGFDCKGTANTVQNGALTATVADLRLAPGDRLAVDFAGTLTTLAGVIVVVTLSPIDGGKLVTFNMLAVAGLIDQPFFQADRSYRVVAVYENHSTATSGAANVQVEICAGTTAVGSGVNVLTNNTNAGFDLNATANTFQTGTLVEQGLRTMLQGDRLVVDFSGTVTGGAGVTVTVELEAA